MSTTYKYFLSQLPSLSVIRAMTYRGVRVSQLDGTFAFPMATFPRLAVLVVVEAS